MFDYRCIGNMAEKVGFEPTVRYSRTAVFKTAALNHSATSPEGASFALFYKVWQDKLS